MTKFDIKMISLSVCVIVFGVIYLLQVSKGHGNFKDKVNVWNLLFDRRMSMREMSISRKVVYGLIYVTAGILGLIFYVFIVPYW